MKAVISNFRSGRHTQSFNQMVIEIDISKNKEQASKYIGKTVVFKTFAGREIKGKVAAVHGNKGRVRAIFETGMPGQSLGKTVEIHSE